MKMQKMTKTVSFPSERYPRTISTKITSYQQLQQQKHSFPPTVHSHLLPLRQVHVSGLDVGQVGDEVVEGLPVDHQAGHALGVVSHDVGRPLLLAGNNGN